MNSTSYSPGAVYRRLLGYTLHYRGAFALAIVAMLAAAATDTTIAWLVKPFLDEGFVKRDPEFIRWTPWVLIGLFIVRGTAGYVSEYGLGWIGRGVIKQIRAQIFERFLHLPTRFFSHETSGALLAKLTYHADQIATSVTDAFTAVIKDGLTVIGLVALMFYLSPKMALLVFIGGPAIAAVMVYVSKRFRRYSKLIQANMGDITHVAEEVINGHRVVKVFGGQKYESAHFETVNERQRRLGNKMGRARAASGPVVQFIAVLALASVIYTAISPAAGAVMTPGTFVSFFGALVGIMGPLRRISNINAIIQRGIAAATSIFELLEVPLEDAGGSLKTERARGELRFEALSFAYPRTDKTVLDGINLEIAPGQLVAFVGRSGSGKSSLLSLLPRFYDPDAGRILLDGHDLREYALSNLRSQLALVDQNVVLFNDTVRRNIAYGLLTDAPEEKIVAATKSAHAWEFIEQMPQGLDTEVGQHGVLLSGGQRQRLALARAFLKDAPVLILDEATSALDSESERHIQAALESLMQSRTTLVIAHRLSTVQKADLIVVMEQGRIVETGRHEDLLARSGAYSRLYRVQLEAHAGA
ncbi:MAG: lipid A export permease/ATP-binding protein MsbA [Nevskiales bacterium]